MLAVLCLGSWLYLTSFTPEPLQADADPPVKGSASIQLGLPAFAVAEPTAASSSPSAVRQLGASSRGAGEGFFARQTSSSQTSVFAAGTQRMPMTERAGNSDGGIQITPKGQSHLQPSHLGTSNRFQSAFLPVSHQSEIPAKASARPESSWESVVDGQATHIDAAASQRAPAFQETQSLQPQKSNAVNAQRSVVPAIPNQPDPSNAPIPWTDETQPAIPPSSGSTHSFGYDSISPGRSEPLGDLPAQSPASSLAGPLGAHSIPSTQSPASVTSGHSVYTAQPGTSGFRATVEQDADRWMSPYSMRADQVDVEQPADILPVLSAIPTGFQPWWDTIVRQPVNPRAATMQVNVSNLLQDALLYSPQVVAIQTEPEVKYQIITQEAARFDWTAFLESTYNDLNDPVGNELTTGNGKDRLLTKKWRFSGGLRRKNMIGGEFQVNQDFGHENQNSRFFIPNNQASSRLELSYRQPLLDGYGRCYNQSEIVLARIDANASEDDVVDALQEHLIEVTSAYWTLYRARAEFFQRQKLLISTRDVLNRLQGRAKVDTIPRQILRAQAAVARAKTGIRRTLAQVKDAEAQLRLLVNSPGMLNGGPTELLPFEAPLGTTESADLRSILQTALFNRADISGAIRQMRGAGVRLGVSQQELLPRLDLLVSGYVADLSGNSNLGMAIEGQYTDNRPGYTVGLEFEVPLANRAARARNEQRQWELKRAINIFRATVEKSLTDVEIGRREVETAHAEMASRYHSMSAAAQESEYLKDRFQVLPEAEDSPTLLLEDLLDSFERLADEESAFVRSQVDHALSLVNLKKQMGILLRSRHDRPSIDSAQQQWVQDRLHTHAPDVENGRQFDETLPLVPEKSTAPSDVEISPMSDQKPKPSGSPSTTGSSKILRTSHHTYEELYVPRGEPIPTHQTVWKRSPLNK